MKINSRTHLLIFSVACLLVGMIAGLLMSSYGYTLQDNFGIRMVVIMLIFPGLPLAYWLGSRSR